MDAGFSERVLAIGQGLPQTADTIAAALLLVLLGYALLVASGLRIRRRFRGTSEKRSLRSTLLTGLFLMTTLPMIALALVIVDRSTTAQAKLAADRLSATSRGIARSVDDLLDEHVVGVTAMARRIALAGDLDDEALFGVIELGNMMHPGFLTMLVADSDARVVVAGRLRNGVMTRAELGDARIADRDYFRVPMATGRPYVSRLFLGRGLGEEPIVAISAPYARQDGTPLGLVEGSLDLGVFERLMDRYLLGDTNLVITDDAGNVVFTTVPAQYPVMATVDVSGPFVLANAPSREFLSSSATTARGWRVFLRAPLAPILRNARVDYAYAWGWLTAAIVISAILATVIARRVTRPLALLNRAVENTDLDTGADPVMPADDAPREVAVVFEHLRDMRRRVGATYRRLQSALAAEGEANKKLAARETIIEEKSRQLELANARLREMSRTDPLTGLANRHALAGAVDISWRAVARTGSSVAVIMLDIDFFKRYNDRYGHPTGDVCLRRVAQLLSRHAGRALDIVARYGGEEFVVILTEATIAAAVEVAKTAREDIAAAGIEHEMSPFGVVTVSAGVACGRPADGAQFEQILEQADRALYMAKKSGRNRIVAAGDGLDVAQQL